MVLNDVKRYIIFYFLYFDSRYMPYASN